MTNVDDLRGHDDAHGRTLETPVADGGRRGQDSIGAADRAAKINASERSGLLRHFSCVVNTSERNSELVVVLNTTKANPSA